MIKRLLNNLQLVGVVAGCVAFALLCGACKKWQWDECRQVGHSASYCAADAAGCFGGTSRKAR